MQMLYRYVVSLSSFFFISFSSLRRRTVPLSGTCLSFCSVYLNPSPPPPRHVGENNFIQDAPPEKVVKHNLHDNYKNHCRFKQNYTAAQLWSLGSNGIVGQDSDIFAFMFI